MTFNFQRKVTKNNGFIAQCSVRMFISINKMTHLSFLVIILTKIRVVLIHIKYFTYKKCMYPLWKDLGKIILLLCILEESIQFCISTNTDTLAYFSSGIRNIQLLADDNFMPFSCCYNHQNIR